MCLITKFRKEQTEFFKECYPERKLSIKKTFTVYMYFMFN